MAKFKPVSSVKGMYKFYCPGCEGYHAVWTDKEKTPCWEFNGDVDSPTASPSILVRAPYPEGIRVCHSFIKDGKIQFLNDCTHNLKGQTGELSEI